MVVLYRRVWGRKRLGARARGGGHSNTEVVLSRPEEDGVESPPVLGVGVVHAPHGEPVVGLVHLEAEVVLWFSRAILHVVAAPHIGSRIRSPGRDHDRMWSSAIDSGIRAGCSKA